jgi:hypothetical protein
MAQKKSLIGRSFDHNALQQYADMSINKKKESLTSISRSCDNAPTRNHAVQKEGQKETLL